MQPSSNSVRSFSINLKGKCGYFFRGGNRRENHVLAFFLPLLPAPVSITGTWGCCRFAVSPGVRANIKTYGKFLSLSLTQFFPPLNQVNKKGRCCDFLIKRYSNMQWSVTCARYKWNVLLVKPGHNDVNYADDRELRGTANRNGGRKYRKRL